ASRSSKAPARIAADSSGNEAAPSVSRPRRARSPGPEPAWTCRPTMRSTLVATLAWKRTWPSVESLTGPARNSSTASSSAAAVGRPAALGLVGREELLDGADPGRFRADPEPPGLDAQPGEVLQRIADVDQFPVEDRPQPVLPHDDVAEPEVAVDDGARRRVGA